MQQRSTKTLIVAILTGLCGIAGTLATVLPGGEVQKGAEKVAQACEANGIRAYPAEDFRAPAAEVDAGTPSPAPQPAIEQPASPFRQGERAEFQRGPAAELHASRHTLGPTRWRWVPTPTEAWPGESKGWA